MDGRPGTGLGLAAATGRAARKGQARVRRGVFGCPVAGGTGGRVAAALAGHPGRRVARAHGDQVGPVLFAYDGSAMARAAIAEAARQLPGGRDAVILTVWRTFNVGFIPESGAQFDAACADDVGNAAAQTATAGVSLADSAGFRAEPLAVQGTPAWKAILDTADEHDASLIVLGSHRHAGLGGRVAGSIAADVATRSDRPVLIVHPDGKVDGRAGGRKPTGSRAEASPGGLLVSPGLDSVELAVPTAPLQQFIVRAYLGNARPVKHDDELGHPQGAEPVGHQDGDAS